MGKSSKAWVVGLLGVLIFMGWFFSLRITSPWTDVVDFNGAVWSQAAHNLLQAGLKATAAVPSVFYFGPMPIPTEGFYGHHPALLHLELAILFKLFGEHEWVARLLPILCSLASAVLIWFLVKRCAGPRAATFAAALFAALPMELHYGSMVNFEPCTLMWMLLGLLGMQRWEENGGKLWWALMVGSFALAMFTAWLGYFLVLLLCAHFAFGKDVQKRPLALVLFGIALFSGAVFLVQIRVVNPGAWSDLLGAFQLRFSQKLSNGNNFTFWEWAERVGNSLFTHIPPWAWLLAIAGVLHARRSPKESGLHWLNWVSFCFYLLSVIYVVVFRNASFVHDYASFYFIAPVAMMGGVGLDWLATWIGARVKSPALRHAGVAVTFALILVMGWVGYSGATGLNAQAYLLETEDPEPPNLVPELGKLIQQEFSPDTEVLCNFAVDYCPQLCFYSQRLLFNGLVEPEDWRDSIQNPGQPIGGIIWMGAPEAKQIVAQLRQGQKREVKIGGVPFCIWKPQPGGALTRK